jgi:ABC-type dipeptide/oligopeptide/nickel transport system permease subunit
LREIEVDDSSLEPGQRTWRRLVRSRSAWIGASIVVTAVFLAVAADLVAPFGPREKDPQSVLAPPSPQHPLGTDQYGYDVLSRAIYGSRLSLLSGLVSMAVAIGIGATAGAIAGYVGGLTDNVIMRLVDVMMSFPAILIAILIVIALDRTEWYPIMIAVGLINVPLFCRQVRATVLTVRSLDYVAASRAMGASRTHVLLKVILPATMSPVIVLATLGLGVAVLEVAGLAFLGIAGQPDDAEWGSMLASAKDHMSVSLWPVFVPGIAISLTVLGFNLLGDGLRDALDPHLRVDAEPL